MCETYVFADTQHQNTSGSAYLLCREVIFDDYAFTQRLGIGLAGHVFESWTSKIDHEWMCDRVGKEQSDYCR